MALLFYNIFLIKESGDKHLIAQSSDPEAFVDMEYPSIPHLSTDGDEMIWEFPDDEHDPKWSVVAVKVRNIKLDTLVSETDYNKIRRI